MVRARPRDVLRPGQVAPLFVVTALVHGAAVVTRFDRVHAMLPPVVHAALLCAQVPLLLVTGYFEGRLDHGGPRTGPLWLQIESRPVKWSLTLGFTYFALVVLQTLGWSFGPMNPSIPVDWPPALRAAWFFGFTFGMSFVYYLAATRALIPALRVCTRPLRRLPTALAVAVLALLGLGLGALALQASALRSDERVTMVVAYYEALMDDPVSALALALAAVFAPMLLGWIGSLIAGKPAETRHSAE